MSDGRHDFDFIFGNWTIKNRKLADQADPDCVDWIEFDSSARAEPIFGGLSHYDRIVADETAPGGPWEGFTLRQFDPYVEMWRIWWASSRNPGHLDPPLAGRFSNGVGVFRGLDTIGDRPIEVKFTWQSTDGDHARWQQSFSFDQAMTWIPNWEMLFSRCRAASS